MARRMTYGTKALSIICLGSAIGMMIPGCPAKVSNKVINASKTLVEEGSDLAYEVFGGLEQGLVGGYDSTGTRREVTYADGTPYQREPEQLRKEVTFADGQVKTYESTSQGPSYQAIPSDKPMSEKAAEALAILLGAGAAVVLTRRLAKGTLREQAP